MSNKPADMSRPSRLLALPTELLQLVVDYLVVASCYHDDVEAMFTLPFGGYAALLCLRLIHPRLLPLLDAAIFAHQDFDVGKGELGQRKLLGLDNISPLIHSVTISMRATAETLNHQTSLEEQTNEVLQQVQPTVKDLTLVVWRRNIRETDCYIFANPDFTSFPRLTTLRLDSISWILFLPLLSAAAPSLAHVFFKSDGQRHEQADYAGLSLDHTARFQNWRTPMRPLKSLVIEGFEWDIFQKYFPLVEPRTEKLSLLWPQRLEDGDKDTHSVDIGWLNAPYLLEHLREFYHRDSYSQDSEMRWGVLFGNALGAAWRGKGIKMKWTYSLRGNIWKRGPRIS